MTRITSLDPGYTTGQLSVYPTALDTFSTLYQAANNATTTLSQTLTYNGKSIVVQDTSLFPPAGILRLGPPPGSPGIFELVYYSSIVGNVFTGLSRGYVQTRQNQWPIGSTVMNPVAAEYHNALKDAVLNIESTLGLSSNPAATSFNGLITAAETQYLTPQAIFRGYPLSGIPALSVRFQNFSEGDPIRYLWDFGDGTKSVEKSPTHTYLSEGQYTVQLNIITVDGGQCVTTKPNYVTVSSDLTPTFFYVQQLDPLLPAYSIQTATQLSSTPATFLFVDQTSGDITKRYWIFDDGDTVEVDDPNIHTIEHMYNQPGEYNPTVLVLFTSGTLERIFLSEQINVL